MALDDNKGTLWFDEWVWLDNDSGSQASAWRLQQGSEKPRRSPVRPAYGYELNF